MNISIHSTHEVLYTSAIYQAYTVWFNQSERVRFTKALVFVKSMYSNITHNLPQNTRHSLHILTQEYFNHIQQQYKTDPSLFYVAEFDDGSPILSLCIAQHVCTAVTYVENIPTNFFRKKIHCRCCWCQKKKLQAICVSLHLCTKDN